MFKSLGSSEWTSYEGSLELSGTNLVLCLLNTRPFLGVDRTTVFSPPVSWSLFSEEQPSNYFQLCAWLHIS